jgi:hypothetical protein
MIQRPKILIEAWSSRLRGFPDIESIAETPTDASRRFNNLRRRISGTLLLVSSFRRSWELVHAEHFRSRPAWVSSSFRETTVALTVTFHLKTLRGLERVGAYLQLHARRAASTPLVLKRGDSRGCSASSTASVRQCRADNGIGSCLPDDRSSSFTSIINRNSTLNESSLPPGVRHLHPAIADIPCSNTGTLQIVSVIGERVSVLTAVPKAHQQSTLSLSNRARIPATSLQPIKRASSISPSAAG